MIRRRGAIEPAIGHMKTDGKLDRNWLINKRYARRRDARGAVRRRSQPADDPQDAAVFFAPSFLVALFVSVGQTMPVV